MHRKPLSGFTLIEVPVVRKCKAKGFTLIELLVVISIIAVLISILLPTLQNAKRQVVVLSCLANLKQMEIGLMVYVTENNFQYPTANSNAITQIWNPVMESPDTGNRQNFIDIAGNTAYSEIYFCPFLVKNGYSPRSSTNTIPSLARYLKHYDVGTNGTCSVGYNMLFLGKTSWHDFTYSGNPDLDGDGTADPPAPGHADAAIVSDHNVVNPGGTFKVPTTAVHSEALLVPFTDSNVLYADGHAETHGTLDENIYVQRGISIYPY